MLEGTAERSTDADPRMLAPNGSFHKPGFLVRLHRSSIERHVAQKSWVVLKFWIRASLSNRKVAAHQDPKNRLQLESGPVVPRLLQFASSKVFLRRLGCIQWPNELVYHWSLHSGRCAFIEHSSGALLHTNLRDFNFPNPRLSVFYRMLNAMHGSIKSSVRIVVKQSVSELIRRRGGLLCCRWAMSCLTSLLTQP